MKKFFNLILAALVIIGAAACTKSDEIVDQTQQGEGLSFYANVVNDVTRAYIDDTDGDKTWNTIWDEGDAVYVGADNADPYVFTYANGKFTCTADGVTSLIGKTVTVGPCNVNEDSTAGMKAWSFTGTKVENFDNNATVNLTADTSFFRYTYKGTGDVTITVTPKEGDTKVFSYCVKEDVFDYYPSITFKGAAEDKFVGFWPQTLSGLEATLSYSINGVKCKEATIDLYPGKVYNLGILTDPVATAYSVPGSHNDWKAGATPMYKSGDLCVACGVTFTKPGAFKILGNDKWYGAEVKVGEWVSASTEANDMTVDAGTYDIYFSEARTMVCVVAAGATAPELPSITWSLVGDFNSWGDLIMESTTTANLFVAKSVKLDAYASFKVRKNKDWAENYGGGIVYMNPDGYIDVYSNGSNISNTDEGTFDFYFDYANKRLYMVTAGTDYTTVSKQTTEGNEPVQEEPEVTDKKLYLQPNSNWKEGGARFAIFIWGGTAGEKWVSMTDADKDGIYEANIPEGYDYGCNVIFCRMNPGTTANNWNNKWNQTSDLKAPTDGKNLYTVKEGTWDKGGGTWSVKQ